MTTISLHSEPFSRDGNLAADGAQRNWDNPLYHRLSL